jgi:photosystem II stability/assembly factor-like uncharacterized protein
VLKSTQGDENWQTINGDLADTYIQALVIDPITPNILYVGTYDSGVFKSTNGGENWTPINTGLSFLYITSLAIVPTTPPTLYTMTLDGKTFKSTDGGDHWSLFDIGASIEILMADPSTPNILYATTFGQGMFKSTDGGANWSTINIGLTNPYIASLAIDPTRPNMLYLGTYPDGMFKSANGGESWTRFNAGLPNNRTVYALAIDPATPTTLYAGTGGASVFIMTTAPGTFGKFSPINASVGVTISPTLHWDASAGAADYEYCYDTTNDDACSGTWTSTGANTHVTLNGLNHSKTYYWQVHAIKPGWTTYANAGIWWSFTPSYQIFAPSVRR